MMTTYYKKEKELIIWSCAAFDYLILSLWWRQGLAVFRRVESHTLESKFAKVMV